MCNILYKSLKPNPFVGFEIVTAISKGSRTSNLYGQKSNTGVQDIPSFRDTILAPDDVILPVNGDTGIKQLPSL